MPTIRISMYGEYTRSGKSLPIKGNDSTKNVFIGVLSPIKSWLCRSSTLNFANRSAENTVTKKPKYGRKTRLLLSFNIIKKTTPGTKPKLTISAKESNSFPIVDLTCSARAAIPSKKSHIPDIRMQ